MTAEREEPGQRNGQKLDDIVQDAGEYYNYLKEKHVQHPPLDANPRRAYDQILVDVGPIIHSGLGKNEYLTSMDAADRTKEWHGCRSALLL